MTPGGVPADANPYPAVSTTEMEVTSIRLERSLKES